MNRRLPGADGDSPTLAWADQITLNPLTPEQEHRAALYIAAHAPRDLARDWLDALGLTERKS